MFVSEPIAITGIRDHDRLEHLIAIPGIRTLNSNGGPAANIVSVGGFLGMGEHYVAVNPAALNVT